MPHRHRPAHGSSTLPIRGCGAALRRRDLFHSSSRSRDSWIQLEKTNRRHLVRFNRSMIGKDYRPFTGAGQSFISLAGRNLFSAPGEQFQRAVVGARTSKPSDGEAPVALPERTCRQRQGPSCSLQSYKSGYRMNNTVSIYSYRRSRYLRATFRASNRTHGRSTGYPCGAMARDAQFN